MDLRSRPNSDRWLNDLRETRRQRLAQLVAERFGGSLAAAARGGIGRKATQIGSLISGRRGIGEDLARAIEGNLGLPWGWLDAKLLIDPAVVPQATRLQLERLTEAAIEGRISWDALTAALEAAAVIAARLPAPPRSLPAPRNRD